MVAGVVVGAALAATLLPNPNPEIGISAATRADLVALGIHDFTGLAPREVFSWTGLASLHGVVLIVIGGFLVGFGTRWAGGCTSGHGICGLSSLQWPSLAAVITFLATAIITAQVVQSIGVLP